MIDEREQFFLTINQGILLIRKKTGLSSIESKFLHSTKLGFD
jgi:hypothetical protein